MIDKTLSFSNEYILDNAILLAKISGEIYKHSELDIEMHYKTKYGFDEAVFVSYTNEDVDLQFCVLRQEKHIVVVFKGSQEKQDWFTNFRTKKKEFNKTQTYVHEGFLKSFEVFKELKISNILENFAEENLSYRLTITGHSLGGAIATIFTAYLLHEKIDKEKYVCYTFGAPPIGCSNFCKQYSQSPLYRIVNNHDPVPMSNKFRIPFFHLSYLRHVGQLKELKSEIHEHHFIKHYIDNLSDLRE